MATRLTWTPTVWGWRSEIPALKCTLEVHTRKDGSGKFTAGLYGGGLQRGLIGREYESEVAAETAAEDAMEAALRGDPVLALLLGG